MMKLLLLLNLIIKWIFMENLCLKIIKILMNLKKLQFIMKEKMILVMREFFMKKLEILIKHFKCMLNQIMKNILKRQLKWLEQQKMKN